jgi:hypothetical protein
VKGFRWSEERWVLKEVFQENSDNFPLHIATGVNIGVQQPLMKRAINDGPDRGHAYRSSHHGRNMVFLVGVAM